MKPSNLPKPFKGLNLSYALALVMSCLFATWLLQTPQKLHAATEVIQGSLKESRRNSDAIFYSTAYEHARKLRHQLTRKDLKEAVNANYDGSEHLVENGVANDSDDDGHEDEDVLEAMGADFVRSLLALIPVLNIFRLFERSKYKWPLNLHITINFKRAPLPKVILPVLGIQFLSKQDLKERREYFLSLLVMVVVMSALVGLALSQFIVVVRRCYQTSSPSQAYTPINVGEKKSVLPCWIHGGYFFICSILVGFCGIQKMLSVEQGLPWEGYFTWLFLVECMMLSAVVWVSLAKPVNEVPGIGSVITSVLVPVSPLGELFDIFKDTIFTGICLVVGTAISCVVGLLAVAILAASTMYMRSYHGDGLLYAYLPFMKPKTIALLGGRNFCIRAKDFLLKIAVDATADEKMAIICFEDLPLVLLQVVLAYFALGQSFSLVTLKISLVKIFVVLCLRLPILWQAGLVTEYHSFNSKYQLLFWHMLRFMLGPQNPSTLQNMSNYSISLSNLGKYEEAAELERQCLELRKQALGEGHPDTLRSMNNYSISLGNLGKYEEAAELDRQCLELRKQALGEGHPDTLISMTTYCNSLDKLGKYEEAARLRRQCLELTKQALGEGHPNTLGSMTNYCNSLDNLGKYEEAAELRRQCFELYKQALGEGHPDTLKSMNNYCSSLDDLGKYEEAAELERQCLELRKQALGEGHPDTLGSMNNYCISLSNLGKYEEAAELRRQCLELYKQALGEGHPNTLKSMNNYCISLDDLGKYEEAAELKRQCLELYKQALGEGHPNTLKSMNNYCNSLDNLGKYEEAAELKRQCLELRKQALGEGHPDTLNSMTNYSISLRNLGKYEEAAELDRQCLELKK